jgi:hypothetical protein
MKHTLLSFLALAIGSFGFGQTEILNVDFQTGFPAGWSVVVVDQQIPNAAVSEYTSAWIMKADPENPTDSVISSTSFFEPEGQANKWLISPAITLGDFGNVLRWNAKSHDPSFLDSYLVLVSKTDNQLVSFTDTIGEVQLESSTWTSRAANISALIENSDGETIYLAFINNSNKAYKLYIDDIVLTKEDPLSSPEIASIQLSVYPNPTQNLVKLSASAPIENVIVCTANGTEIHLDFNSENQQLDFSNVTPGIYFARVFTQVGNKVVKIIRN